MDRLARPGGGRPGRARRGRARALLAAGMLAATLAAGCDAPPGREAGPYAEAWQVDEPARFTFPPVGLEEFALERTAPGSAEIVIRIGADGTLEGLDAEKVQGFDQRALEALFAAIRHARFAPATRGGRPVASIKRIAFDVDPFASRFVTTARAPDTAR
jgi:hypothetical protein